MLGVDHPDTLTTRNDLAVSYLAAGRTAEAITLHERTLADRERVLGVDHPYTLGARNNLGVAYVAAGRTAEAIALYERTLADMERALATGSPGSLTVSNGLVTVRNNLAAAHQAAEAVTLREQKAGQAKEVELSVSWSIDSSTCVRARSYQFVTSGGSPGAMSV